MIKSVTHALWVLSVHVRCMIAYDIMILCVGTMRLTMKMMPKDCCGATYMKGRLAQSHERFTQAIGPEAARRYIAHRRSLSESTSSS